MKKGFLEKKLVFLNNLIYSKSGKGGNFVIESVKMVNILKNAFFPTNLRRMQYFFQTQKK